MAHSRKVLLEHFDQEVHARFRDQLATARQQLDKYQLFFWELSKFILNDIAQFDEAMLQFELYRSPMTIIKTGRYHLVSKSQSNVPGDFLYRLAHPLGEYVIAAGQSCQAQPAHVYFDISNHPVKISSVGNLRGQSGWLALDRLKISSFEKEDYLLFTALTDKGKVLDIETCEKLFYCRGASSSPAQLPDKVQIQMKKLLDDIVRSALANSMELNNSYFMEECEKLDKWADDISSMVEWQLKANKEQIRQLNRQMGLSRDLLQQHDVHLQIRELESQKKKLRMRLFEVEDEISAKREALIDMLQKRMKQEWNIEHLYTIRWSVV
jgi:hypothetical protein